MDLSDIKLSDLLKEKNKILNGLIILFALLIAYNIHKAQSKLTQAVIERKETEIKKNQALDDILRSEGDIGNFKIFLQKKDMSMIINTINELAKGAGVRIASFKPLASHNYPLYTRNPVEISLKADSYHSIGKFISRLESHHDIYIVESINLKQNIAGTAKDEGLPRVMGLDTDDKVAARIKLSTVIFKFD